MSSPTPSQTEILQALRNEGTDALAQHFNQVRERLKQIVRFRMDYRLNGRVSESDVIQEAYVRAADRLDRFLEQEEPPPFFVWLRREVTQRLQEVHRFHFTSQQRDVRREASLPPATGSAETSLALAAHLVAQITSPSQCVERAEQIAHLESTLNGMDALDREVIALRHFEELSNQETAEVLNIAPAAASKRYLRALHRLRQIMLSLGGPDATA